MTVPRWNPLSCPYGSRRGEWRSTETYLSFEEFEEYEETEDIEDWLFFEVFELLYFFDLLIFCP